MSTRVWALPGAAVVAVAALLGFQVALGGGDFVPTAIASPCVERPLPAPSKDLDQVTQNVVVAGVQDAACSLGTSREALLLALASPADRAALAARSGNTDDQVIQALKQGMLKSVKRLDAAGRLPKASELVTSYAGELGLSGLAEQAVKSVPPEMVDRFLPTGAIVERAIDGLDLAALLSASGGPEAWEPAVRDAIRDAAIAEVKEQILDKIPSSLTDLLGG